MSMEKNTDGFYRLTFKSRGFPEKDLSPEENKAAELEAQTLRDRFWQLTGFSEQRELEVAKILYIKAVYLISSRPPVLSRENPQKAVENRREYLRMLVCDQVTLFKDTDPAFRDGQMHRRYFLARNRSNRNHADRQDAKNRAIEYISKRLGVSDDEDEKSNGYYRSEESARIASNLLKAVVLHATEREKSSVYAWLFSDRHIKITKENENDYREHFLAWREESGSTDGKTDEEAFADFLESPQKTKEFVRLWKQRKNPYDYWMLDLRACMDDFYALYDESKQLLQTTEQCSQFILHALAEYIRSYTIGTEEPFQDPSKYRSLNLGVPSFKKRLKRLEKLEDKFLSDRQPHLIVQDDVCWAADTTLENTPDQIIVEQLAQQIRQFFQELYPDRDFPPRKVNTLLYLQRRIAWVLQNRKVIQRHPSASEYQDTELPDMTPMLLLNMVLQLEYTIWEDVGASEFDPTKEEICNSQLMQPTFFPRIKKAKQRLEQIKLLKEMSDALNLSVKDQMENYREFLLKQGIKILSRTEALFWRKVLHKRYELLPLVGFQLCYINYAREAVPHHLETLACEVSSCWRTQYHGYYVAHRKELKRDAKMNAETQDSAEDYSSAKKSYAKMWNDASQSTDAMLGFLDATCKKLNATVEMTPEERDYQIPILETKLRMLLRDEAIQTLFDHFQNAYGVSLKNGLKDSV